MRLLLSFMLIISTPALAQQLVDETDLRFPELDSPEYTNDVSLADVDNDGDLDIFFANGEGYANAVSAQQSRLYINNEGKFTDATSKQLKLGPKNVRDGDFADVDGDGWVDLVLSGAFGDPPRLLMNKEGVFTDESLKRMPKHDGWWGSAVVVGDVDLDGDLDIYLTNSGKKLFGAPGGQDRLYLNDGKGYFTDVTVERLPKLKTRASLHAKMADVDNDGDLDILVGNREVKNNLLINDGKGYFSDESVILDKDGKWSHEIEAIDLDGDGWLDLMVINGNPKDTRQEMVLLNTLEGGHGFQDVTHLLLPSDEANPTNNDSECEVFDFDHDGDYDVLIAGIEPGGQRLLINDGKGGLTAAPDDAIKGVVLHTLDLEIGDLDGDGRPDVVTGQGEYGPSMKNRVLMNKGAVDDRAPKIDNFRIVGGAVPFVAPVRVVVRIRDSHSSDAGPRLASVTGAGKALKWAGGSLFMAELGAGLITEPIKVIIEAADRQGNVAKSDELSLSPRHPLDVFFDGLVNDDDVNIMVDHLIDKGGLGDEADINGDGKVDLSDAQLLAAGIGGFPTISRVFDFGGNQRLVVGASFGSKPSVKVGGKDAEVTESGEFSMLCTIPEGAQGTFVVTSDGNDSNVLGVAP